jgi:predicted HTH domain antitoxin
MQVVIEIPDAFAESLSKRGGDLSRQALEALVVEAYKAGEISTGRLKEILGFGSIVEADGFLKERGVMLPYSVEDYQKDCATLDRLFGS